MKASRWPIRLYDEEVRIIPWTVGQPRTLGKRVALGSMLTDAGCKMASRLRMLLVEVPPFCLASPFVLVTNPSQKKLGERLVQSPSDICHMSEFGGSGCGKIRERSRFEGVY